MATDINEFTTAFSGERKFFLHLPVLWTVSIDGISNGSINSILSDAGEKWKANTNPSDYTKSGNILISQEVSIPNESSNFSAMESGAGMGGFLPGYALNSRSNFLDRGFTINFLETEIDLIHNFITPWMIAVGINGLVGSKLKGNVEVRQFTNSGKLMKGYKFKKVFPTNVEGFTLNYDSTDFKIKSVTFACENYEQL